MNITSILGFLIAFAVVYGGVIHPSPKPDLFLDSHAMILVLGGTTAAAMIAFPIKRLYVLVKVLILGVLFKRNFEHRDIAIEIVSASSIVANAPAELKNRTVQHPFLQEGYFLIAEGVLSEDELKEVLQRRAKFFKKIYAEDAKLLTALAKFPPAFGLLGATTGMISMMTNLGKGGQDAIGPAMAVALVATFWGIAMANLVLLPLADYASKAADEDFYTRQLIVEGLILLIQKQPDLIIVEKLNCFLGVKDRIQLKSDIDKKPEESSTTPAQAG